jgi:hypothetical protein
MGATKEGVGIMSTEHIPLYDHGLLPDDLLTYEDMQLLKRHYAASRNASSDKFELKMKAFGADERTRVGEILTMLRDHGFVLDGFLPSGDIRFQTVIRSQLQIFAESCPAGGDIITDTTEAVCQVLGRP